MNKIDCPKCGAHIEVDKALEGQIEARVLAAERHKHEDELSKVKKAAAAAANKLLAGEKELVQQQASADLELAKKKLALDAANLQRTVDAEQDALIKTLKGDAEQAKKDNKKLREDLGEMMTALRTEKTARENADLEAQKKLTAGEDKLREEVALAADEKYRLKMKEQEKKLTDMQKSLDDAQRKATQGSQQGQGEVLELELEGKLAAEFPIDSIDEVKKGSRGADVQQTVKNDLGQSAGLLLWEVKNGKWQPAWIAKFKNDIRAASANIGIIVSAELPPDYGDMHQLDKNVWAVKPRLAVVLAAALRGTILQVDAMSRMNVGKDAKMEALFGFISGPEFKHRVEAIVENYGMLQGEIEKEKRSAALRWAHQEKSIRAVIDNTIGMYGDLQGITSRALPAIKSLELEDIDAEGPETEPSTDPQSTLL